MPRPIFFTSPRPFWSRTCSAYSPDSSESQASFWPSGDHDGSRSATAGERVRLRTSPFSAGTVRISPRASNATRLPPGDSAGAPSFFSTFAKRGRTSGKSPARRTSTGFDAPVAGS